MIMIIIMSIPVDPAVPLEEVITEADPQEFRLCIPRALALQCPGALFFTNYSLVYWDLMMV